MQALPMRQANVRTHRVAAKARPCVVVRAASAA